MIHLVLKIELPATHQRYPVPSIDMEGDSDTGQQPERIQWAKQEGTYLASCCDRLRLFTIYLYVLLLLVGCGKHSNGLIKRERTPDLSVAGVGTEGRRTQAQKRRGLAE